MVGIMMDDILVLYCLCLIAAGAVLALIDWLRRRPRFDPHVRRPEWHTRKIRGNWMKDLK
tara:strand:+ start:1191 stop:1370 length:180 start_codon:yes stop_codon:yes gene_type:complete